MRPADGTCNRVPGCYGEICPAELILRFFVEAQEARQFPTVSLSTEVMQIAASLGARVDVDVECHCCEEDDMLLLDPILEERRNET